MIKANELRLGNRFSYQKCDYFVSEIHLETVIGCNVKGYSGGYFDYSNLQPILITSKILSKTELEKMSDTFFYFWKSSMFSISKIVGKWEICICSENTLCRVKYLHELQNLYFALTGSELVFSTEP